MNCQGCGASGSRTLNSCVTAAGAVRRRRACSACGHRWTTHEVPAAAMAPAQALHAVRAQLRALSDELARLAQAANEALAAADAPSAPQPRRPKPVTVEAVLRVLADGRLRFAREIAQELDCSGSSATAACRNAQRRGLARADGKPVGWQITQAGRSFLTLADRALED